MNIKREDLYKVLNSTKRFVGISYIKKNGESRIASALMHKCYVGTGTGLSKEDQYERGNILYYDMGKHSFRNANIENIVSVRIDGFEYKVIG